MILPRNWVTWMVRSGYLESNLIVDLDKKFNISKERIGMIIDKVESPLVDDITHGSLGDASISIFEKLVVHLVSEYCLPAHEIREGPVFIDALLDVFMETISYSRI